MEVEIRRRRQTLYYSGRAFILFGVWSMIKIFFHLYLNPIDGVEIAEAEMLDYKYLVHLIFWLAIGIVLLGDFVIRLYIGLSAMGEAKGKKKRILYLLFALLYMILTVYSYYPSSYDADNYSVEIVTAIFLDATSSIALIAIIINSWKLRRLGK